MNLTLTEEDLKTYLITSEYLAKICDKLLDDYRSFWYEVLEIKKPAFKESWDQESSIRLKLTLNGYYHAPIGPESFESLDENNIYYEGDEYWSYGGHEHYSYSLPTRFLFDDWKAELRPQLELMLEQHLLQKDRSKQAAIEKEKLLLKQLKEKYNG